MSGPEHAALMRRPAPPTAADAPRRVQAHRRVGAVDDPLEREADDVARRIVASLADAPVTPGSEATRVHRTVAAPMISDSISRVRRAAGGSAAATIGPSGGGLDSETDSLLTAQLGRGRKLDASTRAAMEPRFGADFGAVRVHDDRSSHQLGRRMSAEAFTVGNDIFFAGQAPDARSSAGQHLLAHELTHVVQQGAAVSRRMADEDKQLNPASSNPKEDLPDGPTAVVPGPDEEEEGGQSESSEADAAIAEELGTAGDGKAKALVDGMRRFQAAHDRVHRRKEERLAKAKAKRKGRGKGRVAIAGSAVATGVERGANVGKHGALNVGRSVERLVGMDANPNTSVRRANGPNTIATATGAYGAVDTETVDPKFTVELVNGTWHPIVTHLKGTYGKITAPLPPGKQQVTGPDPVNSKAQIKSLLNTGGPWYMTEAVDAHESVHEAHMHDALDEASDAIVQMIAAVTVTQAAAPTKTAAIAAIKADPNYDAIANLANPNDSDMREEWDDEYVHAIRTAGGGHDHDGPTQTAEADVVEPMINKINAWRKKNKLKKIKKTWTCTNSAKALQVPKGRKNP